MCVLWCGGAQGPAFEGVYWLVPSLQFVHVGVVVALGGLCVLKACDLVVVWWEHGTPPNRYHFFPSPCCCWASSSWPLTLIRRMAWLYHFVGFDEDRIDRLFDND